MVAGYLLLILTEEHVFWILVHILKVRDMLVEIRSVLII